MTPQLFLAVPARRVARHVFVNAWPLWLTLGGFGVAALIHGALGPAWAAGALEFGGLAIVAWGLHRLRTDFRRPSLLDAARDWLTRFRGLLARPQTIHLQGTASVGVTMTATGILTTKARPGATIEERVAVLEKELERVRERHDGELATVRGRVDRIVDDVAREREDRTRDSGDLKRAIEELAVGGLNLETIGLAWLLVGVVLGSLPTPAGP